MNKFIFSFLIILSAGFLREQICYAQPAADAKAKPSEEKAAGGKNDKAAVPVPHAFWAQTLPTVDGKVEQRYDINRDGLLQTSETKILLRDVMAEIKANGTYNIGDTPFLKAYDKNHDGIINKFEAEEIKKDLSYE